MINIGDLRRATYMLDSDIRWRWVLLCLYSVLAALLEAVGAFGVFWLIGIVHSPANAGSLPIVGPMALALGYDGSATWLIGCALAVMVFYVLKNAFLIFHYRRQVKLPYDAYVRVSTALLRRYLNAGYEFHLHRNSAESIRNLLTSADIVFRTVLVNAVTLINEALTVIAVIVVLLMTSPTMALIVGVMAGIIAWLILMTTQKRVTKWGAETQTQAKDLLKVTNHALGAIKELKILHREDYFLQSYHQLRERQARATSRYETFQYIPNFTLEALFTFIFGSLIIAIALSGGTSANMIPLLGLYGYAGFRLMPAVARISAKLQRLGFGSAAVNQVYADYVRFEEKATPEALPAGSLPLRREIVVEGISYTYPKSNRPALRDVSLTIPAGRSIGIVGSSGGGKTTLVDILLGLLKPSSGRVLVDGVDIVTSLRAWQNNIGYVPQSPYLLDDTLRRNIAFGVQDNEIDEAALAEAVRRARLTEVVAKLPLGLDTEIGERGVRISGGQRQRIVIARALYRGPSVLVFDEATSELDNVTEGEIASEIEALSREKTVIVVAHRMTTVRSCDSIVFLVDGQVADIGRYDELLARNPDFTKLATSADNNRAAARDSSP